MSLPHALLVSLLEKSSAGYELARRFDQSIGYFWRASHQQIYRELARMEQAGWIRSVADATSKTRKRWYFVEELGVQELKRWVATHEDPALFRDAFFIRMRADAKIGSLQLNHELKARIAHHQLKLQTFAAIEQRDFLNKPLKTRALEIQHMILKGGMLYEENMLKWSEEMLAVIEKWDQIEASPSP